MAKKQMPRYLLTKEGHVWVTCKICKDAIPVWQSDDNGERSTFTCPWCRKETIKSEVKLPIPEFVNFKQPVKKVVEAVQ